MSFAESQDFPNHLRVLQRFHPWIRQVRFADSELSQTQNSYNRRESAYLRDHLPEAFRRAIAEFNSADMELYHQGVRSKVFFLMFKHVQTSSFFSHCWLITDHFILSRWDMNSSPGLEQFYQQVALARQKTLLPVSTLWPSIITLPSKDGCWLVVSDQSQLAK